LTTYFGPRTECAGFDRVICRTTRKSYNIRTAAWKPAATWQMISACCRICPRRSARNSTLKAFSPSTNFLHVPGTPTAKTARWEAREVSPLTEGASDSGAEYRTAGHHAIWGKASRSGLYRADIAVCSFRDTLLVSCTLSSQIGLLFMRSSISVKIPKRSESAFPNKRAIAACRGRRGRCGGPSRFCW
jgi:hypothetical protein